MSEEKRPRHSGEFVIRNHALPPVKIDASQWPRNEGPRTTGDFVVKNHALPPVAVNMVVPEQVFLELTLTLAEKTPPENSALRIASFVVRLDVLEKALGGSGIIWNKDRSAAKNGDLTLVVSTFDFASGVERFKRLAAEANRTMAESFGAVRTLARIYRVTPAGQHEDDFEIKYPPEA